MLNKHFLAKSNIISNAKVNIGLNISTRLKNNYHNIETLIQEVSFSDEINITIFEQSGNIEIKQSGINIGCPLEKNTCYIVTNLLKKKFGIKNEIKINIKKNIPIGSGLGGGSSNAASILNFFNKKFKLKLSKSEKSQICQIIGMDVPFFIDGGLQFAEGMGEELKLVPPVFKEHFFVLVFPKFKVSTPWAYANINKRLPSKKKLYNLLAQKKTINFNLFGNDFESIVIPRYPEIRDIKKYLLLENAIFSSLSGSGSTVFGIFNNFDEATNSSKMLKKKKYHTVVATPIYR